jgi:hypothetical protein
MFNEASSLERGGRRLSLDTESGRSKVTNTAKRIATCDSTTLLKLPLNPRLGTKHVANLIKHI